MFRQAIAPPASLTAVVGRGAPSNQPAQIEVAPPRRRPQAPFPRASKEHGEVVVNSPKAKLDVLVASLARQSRPSHPAEADPQLPAEESVDDRLLKTACATCACPDEKDSHAGFAALNASIARVCSRIGETVPLGERFRRIARHLDGYFAEGDSFAGLICDCREVGCSSGCTFSEGSQGECRADWKLRATQPRDELRSLCALANGEESELRCFARADSPVHASVRRVCALLGSMALRDVRAEPRCRVVLRDTLASTYCVPSALLSHLPHVVQRMFVSQLSDEERQADLTKLDNFLRSLPLWRCIAQAGAAHASSLAQGAQHAEEQYVHEKAAYESIVAHWKRYSLARIFCAWRGAAQELRMERASVDGRHGLEQELTTMREHLEQRQAQVRQLMDRVMELQAAHHRERQGWAQRAETDRAAISTARLFAKELQERVQGLEKEKLVLEAKCIFIQREADRQLAKAAAARSAPAETILGRVSSRERFAPAPGLTIHSRVADMNQEDAAESAMDHALLVDAVTELVEQLCASIAPIHCTALATTARGDGERGGERRMEWARVHEKALRDPAASIMELCHQEKITRFSYDKAEVAKLQSDHELPFPTVENSDSDNDDIPDAIELLLACCHLFSPIPQSPTVCIARDAEPRRVAELRAKIRGMLARARTLESLRTRAMFDIAMQLVRNSAAAADAT